MNYKRCQYIVEGECEEQLINALKVEPILINPGKIKVHNIIQEEIPRRDVNMIKEGTRVVFVFDTDVEKTDILLKNIAHVKKYVSQVKVLLLAQVLNFEDEIARATDVKKAQDLTRSSSVRDFKSAICKMKVDEFRNSLERHHLDVSVLWTKKPLNSFSSVIQNEKSINNDLLINPLHGRSKSKYELLWRYIKDKAPSILTFDEVERVCGFPIDHSFLNAKKELEAYGYKVGKISMKEKTVRIEECD